MSPGRILLAVILITGGTHAATVLPALGQDDVGGARAHFSRGTRLYEVGEYRQALSEFKEAHVAKPDPAFLYNIAQCHRLLGELDQAVVLYKRYLTASPNAANRAEVEKRIAEIETGLAEAKRRPRPEVPAAPPSSSAGASVPMPSAAAPRPLIPRPQATDVRATPSPDVAVAPVTVSAAAEPKPSGSSLRYLRWVGVGVTVALAGAAIAAGISTSSRYDELKNTCGKTPDGCDDNDIDGVKTRALLTNLLLGAAGLSAVGTGVLFYLTPREGAVQMAWRF